MRIQHNIMAMGAYRNYTNNLNAMKKNLEKLSSGYKINRAGDDAAGLAISEKMRAQITGLTTAQKNAKDGISLVQTAEGALTEVHDMLNRMVELATQSANGTYDNETDRAQLQKEVSQLLDEINRIADSSNFNGIKLLDGSMDSSTVSGVKYEDADLTAEGFFKVSTDNNGIGGEDEVIGGKEIWETEGGAASKAGFEIDMDGTSVTLGEGDTFTLTIEDANNNKTELTITGPADGKSYTSSELAKALADSATDGKVTIKDADGNDQEFTVKADGKKLVFNTTGKEDFKLNNNAKVTWTTKNAPAPDEPTPPTPPTEATVSGTLNTKTQEFGAEEATSSVWSIAAPTGADQLKKGDQITIGGKTYKIVDDIAEPDKPAHPENDEVNLSEVNTTKGLADFYADKLSADATLAAAFDISVADDGKISFTALTPGVNNTAPTLTAPTFADKDGNALTTTNIAVATTQDETGAAAGPATGSFRITSAKEDAIKAAAEAANAGDGDIVVKKTANGKYALYAGDAQISDEETWTAGVMSFKAKTDDGSGDVLMRALVTGADTDVSGDIKTDLTFTAATEGSAAGEAGLVAYAEGDTTTGTSASIGGTLTTSATAGGSPATQATVTVGIDFKDSGSTSATPTFADGDKVQIVSTSTNAYDLTFVKNADGWALDETASNNPLSGYTASFDGSALTLTKDDAGATTLTAADFAATTVTPHLNDSNIASAAGQTPTVTDGAAAVAGKTVTLSAADNTNILAATDGKTIADGAKFTIKSDGTNVALYAGDTKISEDATFSTSGTVDFVDAEGNTLMTADFSQLTGISDITSAGIDTGLTYTAATSGTTDPTDPVEPSTPDLGEGEFGSGNIAGDLSSVTELSGLTDFAKETPLTDDQVAALKNALTSAHPNGITVPGATDATIDLSAIDLTGVNTVGGVAEKIYDAAVAAVEAAGANVEVVGVYADANYTTLLAGPGDAASSQALTPNDGFYIKTKATTTDTTDESTVKASGTINKGLQNVTDNNSGDAAQLANTVVDFSEVGAWSDGAKITIGDTTYTVALGEDSKFKNASNVVDLTDLKAGDTDLNKIAAERLTVAANGNSIFSVGHDGEGHTTLQQRTAVKESTDMSDHDKIASYLGVSTANANSLLEAKPGNGLTLQIGDTAESFNQLKVDIKDMHAESLGLKGLDISTQAGAADAISKIKNAINTVSDVRGTLGATQNRLDHTINNLSVMTENIQDAESTIRDTDVADEMMAYTKNNILIQSAQAMLAQANQVPQGVLQLLQ